MTKMKYAALLLALVCGAATRADVVATAHIYTADPLTTFCLRYVDQPTRPMGMFATHHVVTRELRKLPNVRPRDFYVYSVRTTRENGLYHMAIRIWFRGPATVPPLHGFKVTGSGPFTYGINDG